MTKVMQGSVDPRPNIARSNRDLFTRFSSWTSRVAGGRIGFTAAFVAVIAWAATGPLFHYSEDWQLVINTGTTIVTFLMVFLIQNSQNRESKAVHLKLDELILAINRARNELIDIEHLTEEQLNALGKRYSEEAVKHHHKLTECFPEHSGAPVETPAEGDAGMGLSSQSPGFDHAPSTHGQQVCK